MHARLGVSGAPTAFSATTPLPAPRAQLAAVAAQGSVYVIGGIGGGGPDRDVLVAPVGQAGDLGTFHPTTPLPHALYGVAATTARGLLYLVGGNDGIAYRSEAYAAPLQNDGLLDAFSLATSFIQPRAHHASVAVNGNDYVIAGENDAGVKGAVAFAPLLPGSGVGTWNVGTSLAPGRTNLAAVAYNNYVYAIGGVGASIYGDTQYSAVNADGSLAGWNMGAQLLPGRFGHRAVAWP